MTRLAVGAMAVAPLRRVMTGAVAPGPAAACDDTSDPAAGDAQAGGAVWVTDP
jgi:hypothetical protein